MSSLAVPQSKCPDQPLQLYTTRLVGERLSLDWPNYYGHMVEFSCCRKQFHNPNDAIEHTLIVPNLLRDAETTRNFLHFFLHLNGAAFNEYRCYVQRTSPNERVAGVL